MDQSQKSSLKSGQKSQPESRPDSQQKSEQKSTKTIHLEIVNLFKLTAGPTPGSATGNPGSNTWNTFFFPDPGAQEPGLKLGGWHLGAGIWGPCGLQRTRVGNKKSVVGGGWVLGSLPTNFGADQSRRPGLQV